MNVPLVDCHMHTTYSDGHTSIEENVSAAIAAGCSLIACTDHLARPEIMDYAIEETRIDAYVADIKQARRKHPEIEIVYGFECDWYADCEADIAQTKGGATFLLGSVHYLDEYPIDWQKDLRIWEIMSPEQVWQRYVDDWAKACFSSAKFDSMAHPDLVKLFSQNKRALSTGAAPFYNQMAEAAQQAGVRIEINTSARRKGLGEFYPGHELLEAFCKAGVPITVGSDAHHASEVGYGIRDAYALAYEVGYRSIDVPRADGSFSSFEL